MDGMASGRGREQKEALHIVESPLSFGDYAPEAGVRHPANQNVPRTPAAKEPMTVRSDYALSRDRYTHFLFTVVGSEKRGSRSSGEDITVLTALARVGIDPWAAGDAAGSARRIVSTLPESSRRAPAPVGPRIFLTWRPWATAAVGLALALIAVNFMVDQVGPLTRN
jgi:hypothetical protein